MKQKLTVSEYMKKYKIKSRQTVYNHISSGEIESVKEGRNIYIIEIDNVQSKQTELDLLKEKVLFLEEQNNKLNKEKYEVMEERKELFNLYKDVQYKQDELNKVMLQLTYKDEQKDKENKDLREQLDNTKKELDIEKSKSWWKKLIGK